VRSAWGEGKEKGGEKAREVQKVQPIRLSRIQSSLTTARPLARKRRGEEGEEDSVKRSTHGGGEKGLSQFSPDPEEGGRKRKGKNSTGKRRRKGLLFLLRKRRKEKELLVARKGERRL